MSRIGEAVEGDLLGLLFQLCGVCPGVDVLLTFLSLFVGS